MKHLVIYTYISALLLTAVSCSKELGKLPENQKVDGNTILDQATAIIALNGAYYQFAEISPGTNVTNWTEHETAPGMFSGYMSYGYGQDAAEQNDYVNSSFGNVYWNNAYQLINAANGVIKGVNALPDSKFAPGKKAGILGESYFLRAYGHFKLLSYFAQWYDPGSPLGVLIRDQFITLDDIPRARSSVADSYSFILNDLDQAIADAPTTNPDYYVTRWAAMALKMRVLMSHGQQADYMNVISLADSIILNGGYQLEPATKDIFYTKGLASKEVILGIQPQPNQAAYYYNLSSYYSRASYVATGKLDTLLLNDPRRSWLIGAVSTYRPGTYFFLKYISAGTASTVTSETAYAFRLSEVYLLKAEAIIRSGGKLQDAKDILHIILSHAGVTDFSAIDNATTANAVLLQIYYEIVRNLVGEDGQEWMALLRLPFNTVQQLKPTITDKIRYILPIPHAEFQNNPAIGDQNPGYSK